mmetsp:Transcript_33055/g.72490  ORF Transcript_33055/g.72490 Transcript_33055/m.72490 type:complete len:206 (+) Transcript_33055:733-1350(+)
MVTISFGCSAPSPESSNTSISSLARLSLNSILRLFSRPALSSSSDISPSLLVSNRANAFSAASAIALAFSASKADASARSLAAIERRRSISSSSVSADMCIRTRGADAADDDENGTETPALMVFDRGCWTTKAFVVAKIAVTVNVADFIVSGWSNFFRCYAKNYVVSTSDDSTLDSLASTADRSRQGINTNCCGTKHPPEDTYPM